MTFQEQNNLLLESYIQNYGKRVNSIEFIFSSECDQRCQYCYLQKHGKEMNYPRANNPEDIITNFRLFLNYLQDNGFEFDDYDIFSGEFFSLPYWEDILDVLYDFHSNLPLPVTRSVTIPTNCSFIADKEKTAKIEEYMKKFEDIRCKIYLSFSIDGPEDLDNKTRPNINKTVVKNDNYYDDIFAFGAKYCFSFHPMIGKEFLKDYKRNYDWFIDNIIQHEIKFFDDVEHESYNVPMMLEIRDPGEWDEESLKQYKEFLHYVYEKDLDVLYEGNKKLLAYHIFDDCSSLFKETTNLNRNQPYILSYPNHEGIHMSCSIQHVFACRIGDLTLAPCHRLYYPNFEYGKFITDENKTKIIGVEGIHPTLAFKIATLNPVRSNLKCGGCKFKSFCLQGCLGSQYEHTQEIFGCIDEVCEMFKVKFETIHEICETEGLYDLILNDPYVPGDRKEYIAYARGILSGN